MSETFSLAEYERYRERYWRSWLYGIGCFLGYLLLSFVKPQSAVIWLGPSGRYST